MSKILTSETKKWWGDNDLILNIRWFFLVTTAMKTCITINIFTKSHPLPLLCNVLKKQEHADNITLMPTQGPYYMP